MGKKSLKTLRKMRFTSKTLKQRGGAFGDTLKLIKTDYLRTPVDFDSFEQKYDSMMTSGVPGLERKLYTKFKELVKEYEAEKQIDPNSEDLRGIKFQLTNFAIEKPAAADSPYATRGETVGRQESPVREPNPLSRSQSSSRAVSSRPVPPVRGLMNVTKFTRPVSSLVDSTGSSPVSAPVPTQGPQPLLVEAPVAPVSSISPTGLAPAEKLIAEEPSTEAVSAPVSSPNEGVPPVPLAPPVKAEQSAEPPLAPPVPGKTRIIPSQLVSQRQIPTGPPPPKKYLTKVPPSYDGYEPTELEFFNKVNVSPSIFSAEDFNFFAPFRQKIPEDVYVAALQKVASS